MATLLSDSIKVVELTSTPAISMLDSQLTDMLKEADKVHAAMNVDFIEVKQQGPPGQYLYKIVTKDGRTWKQDIRKEGEELQMQFTVNSWFSLRSFTSQRVLRDHLTTCVFDRGMTYFKITYL